MSKPLKRLFISLPMRDRTIDEIRDDLNYIKSYFESAVNEEFELIDTVIVDEPPIGQDINNCWYLGESIKRLSCADICIFHKDWAKAAGCIMEYGICILYDIPHIMFVDDTDELLNKYQSILSRNYYLSSNEE